MDTQMISVQTQPLTVVVTGDQPLDRNPAVVYLMGLGSPRSRTVQKQALEVIAAILGTDIRNCNWGGLRFQHTQAIRSELASRYRFATCNRFLCALRGALKAAWQLGLMSGDDYFRARDVQSVTGTSLPAGRALGAGEIAALLGVCEDDPSPAGCRDAALIAILYSGGLRRAEIVGLDLMDFDQETGALTIRFGKRNKSRIVYLANGAIRAVGEWVRERGGDSGPLFFPIDKGGNIHPRRMSNQAVYNLLKKRGVEAGLAKFSPHDIRRSFISDLLDKGADISVIAKLAGHASVNTTVRYDRRPESAKMKVANLLYIPFRGRMV